MVFPMPIGFNTEWKLYSVIELTECRILLDVGESSEGVKFLGFAATNSLPMATLRKSHLNTSYKCRTKIFHVFFFY